MEISTNKMIEKKYIKDGIITIKREPFTFKPLQFTGEPDLVAYRLFNKETIFDGDCATEKNDYYTSWIFDGEVFTFDELLKLWFKTKDDKYRELCEDMEQNRITRVCKCNNGEYCPMEEDDKLFVESITDRIGNIFNSEVVKIPISIPSKPRVNKNNIEKKIFVERVYLEEDLYMHLEREEINTTNPFDIERIENCIYYRLIECTYRFDSNEELDAIEYNRNYPTIYYGDRINESFIAVSETLALPVNDGDLTYKELINTQKELEMRLKKS